MSFVVGTVSGALVAGGIYYALSNTRHTKTEAHKNDLHSLSQKLVLPPHKNILAPPTAAERIAQSPVKTMLKGRWNEEIENLFKRVSGWEKGAEDWSRGWLYWGSGSAGSKTSP